ncbi:hypothetical protein F4776DRAFT_611319 [Hypoxylon sp. NC0597]|nr:hypothetical protein F4776DRAFT_611319 [Hypoxylon sp. NC0597]
MIAFSSAVFRIFLAYAGGYALFPSLPPFYSVPYSYLCPPPTFSRVPGLDSLYQSANMSRIIEDMVSTSHHDRHREKSLDVSLTCAIP